MTNAQALSVDRSILRRNGITELNYDQADWHIRNGTTEFSEFCRSQPGIDIIQMHSSEFRIELAKWLTKSTVKRHLIT
jgi:hypothetical protein